MYRHLDREIERLKKLVLSLSAAVEGNVMRAVEAVTSHNAPLAMQVIDGDEEIDQMEVDVEEECLKLLALYQPVAVDLRFIIAILKINNDLERIGDEAVNIAERAVFLAQHAPNPLSFNLTRMAELTQSMLQRSLDALINMDVTTARKVGADDDAVDDLNREMYHRVQAAIRQQPDQVEPLMHHLSISRHLERIADYATNIAEDVVYLIDGEIIRHKTEAFK